MKRDESFDPEKVIVNVVQNAIDTFQRRVAVHYGKDEVSLTAELEEKIEMTLAELYDIHIKREYNMGRALKGLGETDLYFYRIQDDQIVDLAVPPAVDRFLPGVVWQDAGTHRSGEIPGLP